ncbi:hypothetical protein RB653_002521 [Dictyostelium firmibasis]|uniref:Uncharacterized protein n=1 Tax=Dictyostelium firmibasis TaxID=79012 RepID=A0AAN7U9D1_9MYCE
MFSFKIKLLLFFLFLNFSLGFSKIVNPWNYQERIDLYITLINSTNIPVFGSDNLNNCLNGLQLQFEWQNRSGRLEIENSTINLKSWWADMNYYLSVIPYLSAMNNGLVPQVEIYKTDDSRFCTTYLECDQTVMHLWDLFFQEIINIKNNGSYGNDQKILQIMWNAHIGSIGKAGTIFQDTLSLLPLKEKKFGNGWAHFVDVIAVVNFNTNYSQVSLLGSNLPPSMISIFDFPPFIPRFTKSQNNVVMSMFAIDDIAQSSLTWNLFMTLIKTATQNENCRNLINNEINNFINSPTTTFITIVINILTNKC